MLSNKISDSPQKDSEDLYLIEDLVDEFLTFLSAATTTSSNYIQMIIYYIHTTPGI